MFIIKVETVFPRELDGKLERTVVSGFGKPALKAVSVYFLLFCEVGDPTHRTGLP